MDEQTTGLNGTANMFEMPELTILPEGFMFGSEGTEDSGDNAAPTTGDIDETGTNGGDNGEATGTPTTDETENADNNPQDGDETQPENTPEPPPIKRELRLKVNHGETMFDVNGASNDELTVLLQKGMAYDQLKAAREDARNAEQYRARVQRFINDEGQSEEVAKALAASLSGGKTYPVNVSDDGVVTLSDDYKPDFPDFAEIETARAAQEPTQAELPNPSLDTELKKIRAAFPGLTEIPKEAAELSAQGGLTLFEAMLLTQMRAAKQQQQATAKENKILRQNAETARKAPVKGVSGGGTPPKVKKDDFLAGLNGGMSF